MITVTTEKDLSMKYLKLGIPDDLHPKFKGHCARINSSMQARIVELITNDVNNGNTVYEVDTVTVDTVDTTDTVDKVDTVNTATVDTVDTTNTVNMLTSLKALIEGLDNKLESLDDRLDKVEKNSGGPKNNPDYQPEVLGPGHKLNSSQLSKRLSDYKISLGGKAMGTGSLANNREKFKDNPQLHSEWIQPYDPHSLYWEYCEEEKVYIVSKIQQSLDL